MASVSVLVAKRDASEAVDATVDSIRTEAERSLKPNGHELRAVHVFANGKGSTHAEAFDREWDAAGGADFVWLLLAGMRAREHALAHLVSFLQAHPSVAAVQPTSCIDADSPFALHPLSLHTVRDLTLPRFGGSLAARIGEDLYWYDGPSPLSSESLAGRALLVRADARQAVGPFAPCDSSEPDLLGGWVRRAFAAGSPCTYVPPAIIVHSSSIPTNAAAGDSQSVSASAPEGTAARRKRRGLVDRLLAGRDPAPSDAAALGEAIDLASDATTIPLPHEGRWFVEIGADRDFLHSAGLFMTGAGLDLAAPAFRGDGAAGRRFVRVIDPGSGAVVLQRPYDSPEPPAPPAPSPAETEAAAAPREVITSSDVTIGPYREGDEIGILALWKKVFGKERDMAMWKWLFSENPAGLHIMLARTKATGRIVSQFAGMQLRVRVNGETHRFAQMVDSMSDPDCRQSLSRSGIFTDTVLKYVETWGKPGEESFGFGLPNRLAYRIGKRTQGYTDVFPLEWRVKNVADLEVTKPADDDELRIITPDLDDPRLEALWKSFRDTYPIITVRDRLFLDWRYRRHPEKTYTCHAVERGERIVGFAATAPNFIEQPIFAVGDWMHDPADEAAGRALLRACEEAARTSGMERILGSFLPAGSPADRIWEAAGYPSETSQWKWVGRIYDPGALTWDMLRTGYYLTLGDSDLF